MKNKFTKKLIALLAVASMVASCCACGSGSSSDDAATEEGDAVSVTAEETNVTDETSDISSEEENSEESEVSTEEVEEILNAALAEWHANPLRGFQFFYSYPGVDGSEIATIDENNGQIMYWQTDAEGGNLTRLEYGSASMDAEYSGGHFYYWDEDGVQQDYAGSEYARVASLYNSVESPFPFTGANSFVIMYTTNRAARDYIYDKIESATTSDGCEATVYEYTADVMDAAIRYYLDPDTNAILEMQYDFSISESEAEDFGYDGAGDGSWIVQFMTGDECQPVSLE